MKKNKFTKNNKNKFNFFNFSFEFLFFFIIFFFVIIDQTSKYYIRSNFKLNESKSFDFFSLNFFSLTYVTNTGVSFGLFKGFNFIFIILSFVVLFFLIYTFFKYNLNKKKIFWLPLSILCSGIIGNLIDRIFFGYVIDFIDFHFWPVFNVADSLMTLSIIWLFFISIRNKIEFI